MLTFIEKIIFTFAVFVSGYFAFKATHRLIKIINLGKGSPDWRLNPIKLWGTIVKTISLQTTWRLRPIPSFFHGLVVWGFIYFLVVNLGDVLHAFLPNFQFLGDGVLSNFFIA